MTYDDFLPFIAPSVSGCPRETVLHHARLAAIKFCADTCVWREHLDTLLADGFAQSFALPLDDQVELVKLLEVTVKDGPDTRAADARIIESIEGREQIRCGGTELTAWTDNRRDLFVNPVPRADGEIDIYLALKPSLASFSFPDVIFAHHAQDIAAGALATLLEMPRCEWTGTTLEVLAQREKFEGSISETARMTERGFGRKRQRTPRFM